MNTDQIYLEFTYSREYVLDLIKESITDGMSLINQSRDNINDWLNKTHLYKSGKPNHKKNRRISMIQNVDGSELALEVLYRTYGREQSLQELVSSLASSRIIEGSYIDQIETWSEIVALCAQEGFIEIERKEVMVNAEPSNSIQISSVYELSDSVWDEIDSKQYLPPMIEPPKKWEDHVGGGLYTIESQAILGSHYNRHDEDISLDVLNILQQVEWVLVPEITALEELPNKKLSRDAAKEFNNQKLRAKQLYQEYEDKTFYFMWQMDKRGRLYSSGYHINLQSTGYKKACLNFKEKHLITGEL